jgi:hypothetical protein
LLVSLRVRSDGTLFVNNSWRTREAWASLLVLAPPNECTKGRRAHLYRSNVPREYFLSFDLAHVPRWTRLESTKNHPGMSRVLGILFHKIAKPVLLKERWIPAYLGDWWLPHCDRERSIDRRMTK